MSGQIRYIRTLDTVFYKTYRSKPLNVRLWEENKARLLGFMYLVWLGIVGCGRGPELGKYMLIHAALQGKTGTNYISTSKGRGCVPTYVSASISIYQHR